MSSGSESDEDFVPDEPEKLSEEDSADEETDLQFENELEKKSRKRKAVSDKKGKSTRKSKKVEEEQSSIEEQKELPVSNPEEEKKRADDLWAKFLEGTDTKPKPKNNDKDNKEDTNVVVKDDLTKKVTEKKKEDADSKERKIFEFAGETIVVEDNIIKETIKIDKSKPAVSSIVPVIKSIPGRSSRSSGGGLSSVLGHLNRKSTLSTLDKSKFDWDTYKKEEGIEEEVKQINKGKDGYLDKQDFLERADHRQYELEREMRTSRRTTR